MNKTDWILFRLARCLMLDKRYRMKFCVEGTLVRMCNKWASSLEPRRPAVRPEIDGEAYKEWAQRMYDNGPGCYAWFVLKTAHRVGQLEWTPEQLSLLITMRQYTNDFRDLSVSGYTFHDLQLCRSVLVLNGVLQ